MVKFPLEPNLTEQQSDTTNILCTLLRRVPNRIHVGLFSTLIQVVPLAAKYLRMSTSSVANTVPFQLAIMRACVSIHGTMNLFTAALTKLV